MAKDYIKLSNSTRCSEWEAEIYPDSVNLSPNWMSIMEQMGINIQVSPLHDKDVKKDGTLKKPHRHVIFQYKNPLSWARVKEDFINIGLVYEPDPRIKYSLKGARAYHTHETPQAKADGKAIYNIDDVIFFGKEWYKEELQQIIDDLQCQSVDKLQMLNDIIEWCENNNCVSYYELFNYCKHNNLDWQRFIIQGGYARTIIEILKSMNYTLNIQYRR